MTESNFDVLRAAFENAVLGYDALRRKLIPHFDAFYGTTLDLLEEAVGARTNFDASTLASAPVSCRK